MKIESHMVRSAPPYPSLPSTYDDFLYARVGEDRNGACLTVLSMLARRNVDPWEEAADLSRLPRDCARQKLVSMITASSDQPSATAELRAVADRVVALLPGRSSSAVGSRDVSLGAPPLGQPPARSGWLLIAIYIGLVFFGQWIAASAYERSRVDRASTASVPPNGETLPSTTVKSRPIETLQ